MNSNPTSSTIWGHSSVGRTSVLLDRLIRKNNMENTKYVGNLTELQCITRFYELGYPVSIPYGDSEKYDFILDVKGKLYRLQCKHASVHKNEEGKVDFISIKTVWQTGYTRNNPAKRHQYTS